MIWSAFTMILHHHHHHLTASEMNYCSHHRLFHRSQDTILCNTSIQEYHHHHLLVGTNQKVPDTIITALVPDITFTTCSNNFNNTWTTAVLIDERNVLKMARPILLSNKHINKQSFCCSRYQKSWSIPASFHLSCVIYKLLDFGWLLCIYLCIYICCLFLLHTHVCIHHVVP